MVFQFFPSLQKFKFDEKTCFQDFCAEFFHQGQGGGGRAAGCQQVVNQEHACAGFEGIHVHRHGGMAIFKRIILLVRLEWKLAFFADRNESGLQFQRGGGGGGEASTHWKEYGILDRRA